MFRKRKSIKELFRETLQGEGSVKPSDILANIIKATAISSSGRIKLI